MNEEEKKALAFLRFYVSDDEDEYFSRDFYIEKNIIETILNLIDKQQKEIEKLKSRKYILNAKTQEIKEIPISDDYISKDKIKEKIKEVENREENYTFDKLTSEDIRRTIIANLEELLGE